MNTCLSFQVNPSQGHRLLQSEKTFKNACVGLQTYNFVYYFCIPDVFFLLDGSQNLDEAHSSPGLHAAAGPGLAEECATLVQ